jgi:hypothetical protein
MAYDFINYSRPGVWPLAYYFTWTMNSDRYLGDAVYPLFDTIFDLLINYSI